MPRSDDLGCVSSTPWTHSNEEVLLTDSLNVEELEKKVGNFMLQLDLME